MIDAPPAIIIQHDLGGRLGDYIERRGRYERAGLRVEFRGECYSSCTVLTGLPKACVSPTAVFGFHAPTQTIGNLLLPNTGSTFYGNVMMTYYPEPVKKWVVDNGGLTERMLYLKGSELLSMFNKCPKQEN